MEDKNNGITDQVIHEFATPVGKIVMGWAFVDKHLIEIDQNILSSQISEYTNKPYRRKLDNKLKDIKREINASKLTNKLKKQLLELMREANRLSKIRTICAHHPFSKYKAAPEPALCFIKQTPTGPIEDWKTIPELEKAADDILTLAYRLGYFAAVTNEE